MKVGDKVLIIANLEELIENYDIVDEMLEYADKEATILELGDNCYYLDIDDGYWSWENILLKPIENKIDNDKETLDKIKDYINEHYKAYRCSWTEFRSEGNGNDVFSDGCDNGEAWALYFIGNIIGMELEEPEESEDEY